MILFGRGRTLRALLALPLLALPASAHASGFALESQGARAMGFAGRVRRAGRGPVRHLLQRRRHRVPEGQAALRRRRVRGGLTTDFTGSGPNPPAGTLETSSNGLGVLPTLYYSQPVSEKTWSASACSGRSGSTASGTTRTSSAAATSASTARSASWSINPTVAFKTRGPLLDRRRASTCRFSKLRPDAPPEADPEPVPGADRRGRAHLRERHGRRRRLQRRPAREPDRELLDRRSRTVTRSRSTTAAQANFVQILTGNTARRRGGRGSACPRASSANAEFTYPASLAVGAALRRRYWTVEADFAWMLLVELQGRGARRSPARRTFGTTLPQDYASTWRGAIGVEYLIRRRLGGAGRLRLRPQPRAHADHLAVPPRRRPLHLRGRRQLEVRERAARLQRAVRAVPHQLDARHQPVRLQRELPEPRLPARGRARVSVLGTGSDPDRGVDTPRRSTRWSGSDPERIRSPLRRPSFPLVFVRLVPSARPPPHTPPACAERGRLSIWYLVASRLLRLAD